MARRSNAKRKPVIVETLETPTEAQLANGAYERDTIIHADTYRRETVYLNRGGDAVARWKNAGKLSDSQSRAIDYCTRLWNLVGLNQRVTANYGETIRITGDTEQRALTKIEAREDLDRVIDYFPGALRGYFSLFENVCRFGEPAGVAGGRLGFGDRTGDARAHQIVCFVADTIATFERL